MRRFRAVQRFLFPSLARLVAVSLSTTSVLHIGRIDVEEQIGYKLAPRGPATRNQGAERLDRRRFWLRDPEGQHSAATAHR